MSRHTFGHAMVSSERTSLDISASQLSHRSEVNSNEFTESRRVIVTGSLGVTKSFKDGIGLDDLLFQIGAQGGLVLLRRCR